MARLYTTANVSFSKELHLLVNKPSLENQLL